MNSLRSALSSALWLTAAYALGWIVTLLAISLLGTHFNAALTVMEQWLPVGFVHLAIGGVALPLLHLLERRLVLVFHGFAVGLQPWYSLMWPTYFFRLDLAIMIFLWQIFVLAIVVSFGFGISCHFERRSVRPAPHEGKIS